MQWASLICAQLLPSSLRLLFFMKELLLRIWILWELKVEEISGSA